MASQRARESRDAELLEASVLAVRAAAAFINERAPTVAGMDWRLKQRADFVSDVDTGAEARIRDVLRQRVPEAIIVGEELSPGGDFAMATAFIVDPLDGTTNFLHGYPMYAVSVAAVSAGELVAGAVMDVPRNELFTARRGAGAFRNGQAIHVSVETDPSRALVGTGFPFKYPELLDAYQAQFARLMRDTAGIRRAGSAAIDLADVACGRFDAFWELRLAPWDIAAGILLVREAGGQVTDIHGVDIVPSHTTVVASNGRLHKWMLEELRQN
jgi:myo-inositol-1(or 4)-monophosphatase